MLDVAAQKFFCGDLLLQLIAHLNLAALLRRPLLSFSQLITVLIVVQEAELGAGYALSRRSTSQMLPQVKAA